MTEHLSPHCIVEIEKTRFDSWRGENMISASVNLTTDKTGEGVVELFDPKFEIIDGFFADGIKPLTARFWFGWELDLGESYFIGILARIEWNDGISTFRFHDHSLKMKQKQKGRYHKKKTDLQILKNLAEDNDLKFEFKPTQKPDSLFRESQPFDSLMQSYKTDWEFAKKIAERAGLALYVRGDTLFAVVDGETDANSIATLALGNDFALLRGFGLSYKLPNNPKGRPSKVTVIGKGRADKRLEAHHDTGVSFGVENTSIRNLPQQTVSFASQRAIGISNKRREYAFEHAIKTMPSFNRRLELRDTMQLAGMGKIYSGKYIVTDITYSFAAGKLECEMKVGADVKKLIPEVKKRK